MIKLYDNEFTLQLRNGETTSLSPAKRTTIIGELLFCHDTGQLYIAQTTAGASDSVLFQIPAVSGTDSGHAYVASGTIDTTASQTITVENGIITSII